MFYYVLVKKVEVRIKTFPRYSKLFLLSSKFSYEKSLAVFLGFFWIFSSYVNEYWRIRAGLGSKFNWKRIGYNFTFLHFLTVCDGRYFSISLMSVGVWLRRGLYCRCFLDHIQLLLCWDFHWHWRGVWHVPLQVKMTSFVSDASITHTI